MIKGLAGQSGTGVKAGRGAKRERSQGGGGPRAVEGWSRVSADTCIDMGIGMCIDRGTDMRIDMRWQPFGVAVAVAILVLVTIIVLVLVLVVVPIVAVTLRLYVYLRTCLHAQRYILYP